MTKEELEKIPIYFKIPITTRYSADLIEFDPELTHVVAGEDYCEKDIYGNDCACWYVSSVFGAVKDKEWLLREIAECGYNPTIDDFEKGLFKNMSND